MMKNRPAMVMMKALIRRFPPDKKIPPAKAVNTSAALM